MCCNTNIRISEGDCNFGVLDLGWVLTTERTENNCEAEHGENTEICD